MERKKDNAEIIRRCEVLEKGYNDFIRLLEADRNFIKYIVGLSAGSIMFAFGLSQRYGDTNPFTVKGLVCMLLAIVVGLFGMRFTDFHIKLLVNAKVRALADIKNGEENPGFHEKMSDIKAVILYYCTLGQKLFRESTGSPRTSQKCSFEILQKSISKTMQFRTKLRLLSSATGSLC